MNRFLILGLSLFVLACRCPCPCPAPLDMSPAPDLRPAVDLAQSPDMTSPPDQACIRCDAVVNPCPALKLYCSPAIGCCVSTPL